MPRNAREIQQPNSYPLTAQQITDLWESLENARNNNFAMSIVHRRSMSSALWDNSDYMVPYAIEDQILKECQRILFRKRLEITRNEIRANFTRYQQSTIKE